MAARKVPPTRGVAFPAGVALLRNLTDIDRDGVSGLKHPDSGYRTGKSDRSRYLGDTADTDQHVKFLLEYLRYQDGGRLWDNTIIIVTADHGEEFKEHGDKLHARTCYEESVHLPLLVRIPGMKPAHVDTRVALVDIVPTLLDLLGLDPAHDDLDGQSLAIPVLEPEAVDPTRPDLLHDHLAQAFFRQVLATQRPARRLRADLGSSQQRNAPIRHQG